MSDQVKSQVAIVDFGMGNLFSVSQACEQVGLVPHITSTKKEILEADAVILPGVGAFADAMVTLEKLDLVGVLQDAATSDKPLMGICLGMQLLLTESEEFGSHRGLGVIEGSVLGLQVTTEGERTTKVPQVGWNRIQNAKQSNRHVDWDGSLMEGLVDGEFMYFVHSYYSQPVDPSIALSVTSYGQNEFCSSFRADNVFGCQFHPERSGRRGIQIYQNLATQLSLTNEESQLA